MKGINFKEPLFNATIERRKTETRRIMEPKAEHITTEGCPMYFFHDKMGIGANSKSGWKDIFPRYKIGEVVALKEPYCLESRGAGMYEVYYLFGGAPKLVDSTALGIPADKPTKIIRSQSRSKSGYANKLFMPEWAARYFIRITAVRAERLQEISYEDCMKEGIEYIPVIVPDCGEYPSYGIKSIGIQCKTPREAYATIIDKINGRGTWDSNPFVWVYGYELCEIVKDDGVKA